MDRRHLLIGVLALSTLGVGYAVAADETPGKTADNQDARETKLVMLKLPAMV